MKQRDYHFFGLVGVNLYLLFQFLQSFTITNLLAIFDHKQVFAYISAVAVLGGIVFIFSNLARAVFYISGNLTEQNTVNMIHKLAVDTLLALACFVILTAANIYMFYFFNSLVV